MSSISGNTVNKIKHVNKVKRSKNHYTISDYSTDLYSNKAKVKVQPSKVSEIMELIECILNTNNYKNDKGLYIYGVKNRYKYADKVRDLVLKGKVLLIPKNHFNILIFSAMVLPLSLLSLADHFLYGYSFIPPFFSGLLALYAIGWGGTVLLLKNKWGWQGKDD